MPESGSSPSPQAAAVPPPKSEREAAFVSVLIPVRNEALYIRDNLSAALRQDYPDDRFEVIVADGRSTDQTRQIVESMQRTSPRLRLVDNPDRTVAAGLNRALAAARGDLIVRLDGHCEYPPDYLRRVVALRDRTGAANAGGVLQPIGSSYVQRAICAALSSRVAIGGAALRAREGSDEVREVDAVHGGCWRRETLAEAGPFAEEMVRNQDDEMSFRLRRRGGRIVQAASIRVRYVVRDRWRKLFFQFAQYGYWKVRLVARYPRQASVRHLAPATLVLLLLLGSVAGLFDPTAAAAVAALAAAYLAGIGAAAAATRAPWRLWPGVAAAMALMHVGYGCGFLAALLPGFGRLRDSWFSRLTR